MLDLLRRARRQGDAARTGEVVAVELHEGRARELEENVRRLGATNVTRRRRRRARAAAGADGFDRALVDAPCSGLGVLAARPDLRWRARPLPELQLELLRAAAARVRPGGTIIYSVCTLNADENEAVVDASGLEPAPLGEEWPAFRHPSGRSSCSRSAPPRDVGVLRRPAAGRRITGAACPGSEWIRTVEVEPSLYAADFARLGEQVEVLLRAGAASSTSTSATGTSSSR